MAIIQNRTTEDGDVLIIKTETPIVGLISLYNFVDTTVGENYPTDYYLKEFRYSINGGLTFSEWQELTELNIQNISITKYNQFILEYRYTHIGTSEDVTLEFDDILVSGDIEDLPYPIYNSTYFKDFFTVNDINIYGWALNVLEKLYLHGILPKYMERGKESNDVLEDQDFINFWHSITHYFAIIVYYARQYRDISLDPDLIEEFMNNKGIELGNASSDDIIYLFNNYIQEYEKRGTSSISYKKVDGSVTDGEFLRLIGFSSPEEFIFALLKNSDTGWCIGKSSPCWNGTENITNIVKGYEYSKEILDLSKYPLTNPDYIFISGDDMLISNVPSGEIGGIYQDGIESKKLEINKNLDYEISFFCKLEQSSSPVTFGLKGYDTNGNNVNFLNAVTGVSQNNFFTRQTLKLTNKYFWIRGVLYNQNKTLDPSNVLIPNGVHLKFDPSSNIKYIIPNILLDNSGTPATPNGLRLYNIKIRPLKTPMTRGQLGINNILLTYCVNNNKEYSSDMLEYKAKQELLPANSFLKIKYL